MEMAFRFGMLLIKMIFIIIKGNGLKIRNMDNSIVLLKIKQHLKEFMYKIVKKVMAVIVGIQEKFIKETFQKIELMVKEYLIV